MSRFPMNIDNKVILGFKQKQNPVLIKGSPRIFLGYHGTETFFKIGFKVVPNHKKKFELTRCLIEIKYDIEICDINTEYMEQRDIDLYNYYFKNI